MVEGLLPVEKEIEFLKNEVYYNQLYHVFLYKFASKLMRNEPIHHTPEFVNR